MKNIKNFDQFVNEKFQVFKDVKEGVCPKCGSKKLKYKGGKDWDKNYKCKDCGFKGTEVYELDRMDIPKFQYHTTRVTSNDDINLPPYDEGEDTPYFLD